MSLGERIRRYIIFFFSVVLQGVGISTITVAKIGTTPISSPNYVASLHSPLTLGDTTMIFNILLIILQIMIINRKIKQYWFDLVMQIPVIFIFSWMIDLSMGTLELFLPYEMPYYLSWILMVLGTVILATAISFSVVASVCMVPGEFFIKVFHPLVNRSFSFVKTFFDIFLVSTAIVISFFLTNFTAIEGVREGTLFAALTTGPLVHFFIPISSKILMPLIKTKKS